MVIRGVFGGCLILFLLTGATDAEEEFINPDRPGIADGSAVIGRNRFQIEIGVQQEIRKSGEARERKLFVPTLLRYGLSDQWEARFESNGYSRMRISEPGLEMVETEGYAPVAFGVKYQPQKSEGPGQPSLGAILRVFLPSGSSVFRSGRVTGDLRLAADWDFAPQLSLNPNVGLAIYEDGQGKAFAAGLFAVTLNYNPGRALTLFVDAGLQVPEERGGRVALIYDAGVAYLLNRDLQLDLSFGTGGAGLTPPHPFLAAGISVRY